MSSYFDGYGNIKTRTHLEYLPPTRFKGMAELQQKMTEVEDVMDAPTPKPKAIDAPADHSGKFTLRRQKSVRYPKFCNAFYYEVFFKENVKKLIIDNYPDESAVARAPINREDDDDEFTLNGRLSLAWRQVESLYCGDWEAGNDEYAKYSSQFTGEIIMFEERMEGGKVIPGFIMCMKAKDPTQHPPIFRQKEGDEIMQNYYTDSARAICEGEYEDTKDELISCWKKSADNNHKELRFFNVVTSVKA